MSRQRVSSNDSSSSFSTSGKYDVFMNIEDEDTYKNFVDHLSAALGGEGFKVFKGDKEHERGAIEESRISIVVFSKSYASSIRCLDELVKIVECMNTMEQIIIPIFYEVKPCVPRYQIGEFQEAFAEHEASFKENIEDVQKWRKTLKEVADLSGFELKDRYESELIEDVVEEVRRKLSGSTSSSRLKMNTKKLIVCLEKLQMQAERMRRVVQWDQFLVSPKLTSLFFFQSIIGFC